MLNKGGRVGSERCGLGARRVGAIAGRGIVLITIAASTALGCDVNRALEQISEARRFAADLLVQFTRASDAANRAVMADTDDASLTFAREAKEAMDVIPKDTDALASILKNLRYANEIRLLDDFTRRFAEYRELDRRILELAVENTNLKAQRLAFGPAQEAATAFRDSLEAVATSSPAHDKWQIEALTARAVATLRAIQVLQAPHIANADDAVMARMEKEMATSEATARSALEMLTRVVPAASRAQVAAASGSLDRFMELNAQVIALSRRNTNVHSLALSLDQKRKLTTACEESLRALRDALATHGYTTAR